LTPSKVIKFDSRTGSLKTPTLLLRTRTGHIIGKIPYENLNLSFVGIGIDELSFDVHKVIDGVEYEYWDKLIDLAIVDYVGYGWFEMHPTLNEDTEIKKSCVCKALENELAQRNLYDFHVNDEDAILLSEEPKFIPTVLYNPDDTKHSLLHRVLSDTPHWTIGTVSSLFNISGHVYECNNVQRELSADGTAIYDFLTGDIAEEFCCVFTFGDYDSEGYKRVVNCYNLEDCVFLKSNMTVLDGYSYVNGHFYDENNNLLPDQNLYGYCPGIGTDTTIFVSKNKLAKSFTRDSDDGSIKNTFKVSGGDDIITGIFPSVCATGTSYITLFGNFQYEDMGADLTNAIKTYEEQLSVAQANYVADGGVYVYDSTCTYNSEYDTCYDADGKVLPTAKAIGDKVYCIDSLAYYENNKCYSKDGVQYSSSDAFYIQPGLYTEFCQLLDRINYLEHDKFPNFYPAVPTLEQVKNNTIAYFSSNAHKVMVMMGYNSSTDSSFDTITRTIESVIRVVIDYRFDFKILNDDDHSITCTNVNKETMGGWEADIKVTRTSKSYDVNDPTKDITFHLTVPVMQTLDSENIAYCEQKMKIAITKNDIAELDITRFETSAQLENYLRQYNLTSLKSFRDSFEACRSSLDDWYSNLRIDSSASEVSDSALISRDKWVERSNVASKVYDELLQTVTNLKGLEDSYEGDEGKLANYQKSWQIHTWLITNYGETLGEEYWLQYNSYIREDSYNNPNYISDGLTDSEILYTCKELYNVAYRELSKACNIQYKINGSLNNIFTLNELETLHDKFALFNYVRCRVDDKIYKLRLVEIRFNYQSPDNIDVTFSDQVVDVSGVVSDLKSVISQSKSMATSYTSTVKQSQQGVKAMNTFDSLQQEGLDSALYLIKNSPEQVMTFDKKGLLGRSMLDEGVYADEQAIYTANGVYFTTDAFDSVNTAIGKFKYNNNWVYGINADYVIGKFIVGQNLSIINNSNSVEITGDGIVLDGGTITWKDGHKLQESDVTNLTTDLSNINTTLSTYNTNFTTFQKQVQGALTGNPVTEIGSDYVISPMIGGGYLYIKNPNDGRSVTIDPQHNMWDLGAYASRTVLKCYGDPADTYDPNQQGSNTYALDISNGKIYRNSRVSATSYGWVYQETLSKSNDDIFKITNTSGVVTIGADSNGNATFSGSITVGDTPSDSTTGFTVDSSGLLKASNAEIYGTIYATDGDFSGNIKGNLLNITNNNNVTTSKISVANIVYKNETYSGVSIRNCLTDSYLRGVVLSFDNTSNDHNFYLGTFLKNGSAFNYLGANTYLNSHNLYFNDSYYISDYTNGVFTNGCLGVGGAGYAGYTLSVTGSGYISEDLRISGSLYLSNDYIINNTNQGIYTNGCLGVGGAGYAGYTLSVIGNTITTGTITLDGQGPFIYGFGNTPVTGITFVDKGLWNADANNTSFNYIHFNIANFSESSAVGVNVWKSDIRLKKNILATKQNAIKKINNIDFVEFDWKNGGHVNLGVVADQVENYIPEAVFKVDQPENSKYKYLKNIDTGVMTTYALKAIQEQQEIIEKLEQRIKELEESK